MTSLEGRDPAPPPGGRAAARASAPTWRSSAALAARLGRPAASSRPTPTRCSPNCGAASRGRAGRLLGRRPRPGSTRQARCTGPSPRRASRRARPGSFAARFAHPDGRARFVAGRPPRRGGAARRGVPALRHHRPGAAALPERRADPPGARARRGAAGGVRRGPPGHRAAAPGYRDGDLARVDLAARHGRRRGSAASPRMRPDTVFLPFHFPGDGAANALTNPALDPVSRMPEFKVCAVRLSRRARSPGAPDDARCACVVVGHGMVGARFAEEVRKHDPGGRRVRLTVLAAEPRPAYNRVLLPNLLSGVMRSDFTATRWRPAASSQRKRARERERAAPGRPHVPAGRRAGHRHRPGSRTVLIARGAGDVTSALPDRPGAPLRPPCERIGYDVLVLATGARPGSAPPGGLLATPWRFRRSTRPCADAARRRGAALARRRPPDRRARAVRPPQRRAGRGARRRRARA